MKTAAEWREYIASLDRPMNWIEEGLVDAMEALEQQVQKSGDRALLAEGRLYCFLEELRSIVRSKA